MEGVALVFGSAVIMDGMGVGLPGVHTWPEDHAGHSGGVSSSAPASDPGDPAKLPDDYGSRPGEPGYADHSNPGMSANSCTATDPALSTGHEAAASMSSEPHASVDPGSSVSDVASYFHH
ncbi:hypothetical protein ABZ345_45555 [Lentzea sp. NPDC005914]|uniref:hypothetical protein n=1 Tax=Lentzea sp. NPDC005914 TaxID=3154572 RepID=UPI0033D1C579